MIILNPTCCEHLGAATETAVYRLHNEAEPEQPYFTVALRVFCPACKVLFRFAGRHAPIPESAEVAYSQGVPSWTNPAGDELGLLITPISPGSNDLGTMAVLGCA